MQIGSADINSEGAYLIAETGVNHNEDIEQAEELILAPPFIVDMDGDLNREEIELAEIEYRRV